MEKYIKKIKLNTLEAKLCEVLIPDMVAIGFDVSVHKTGIAVLRTTNDYLILEQVRTVNVPKNDKFLDSVNAFLTQIKDFKNEIAQKYKVDLSIIEDCFFLRNANTLKALARFGILIYDKFRDISEATRFVLPTQARKAIHFKKSHKSVKGYKLKKEIINHINYLLETNITDDDIADATVLALAGLIKE